jgi:hypothetical protein
MKEGILHIKLMNGLGARQCQSENHPNSCWLDDRAKSLIIINSPTLCKTTKNPPDFIAVKRAIRQELVTKYPFSSNKINTRWSRHQGLGVIGLQCIELSLHNEAPGQIRKDSADNVGTGERTAVLRLRHPRVPKTIFEMGAHDVCICD